MAQQQEYALGYALAFGLVLLGMLAVCIPRPRKGKFLTEKEAEKENRINKKRKANAKKRRSNEKSKKKAAKAKVKAAKKRGN